jgi:hypothetical protein
MAIDTNFNSTQTSSTLDDAALYDPLGLGVSYEDPAGNVVSTPADETASLQVSSYTEEPKPEQQLQHNSRGSLMAIPLIFLTACTTTDKDPPGSETDNTDTDPPEALNVIEQFYADIDTVTTFTRTHNNSDDTPIDFNITDTTTDDDIFPDGEFRYSLNEPGTTYLGLTSHNALSFSIDPQAVNQGRNYDGPYIIRNGNKNYYSPSDTKPAGSVTVSLKYKTQVDNGEAHKDDSLAPIGRPFTVEMRLGSDHHVGSSIDGDPANSCYPASPVVYVSDYARSLYPNWYGAIEALTTQTPVPQNSLTAPNSIPWLPQPAAHEENSNFTWAQGRNIKGPFYSAGQDNPYKGEFGTNVAMVEYNPVEEVTTFTAEDLANNREICFASEESDGVLGATYFTQTPMPLGTMVAQAQTQGLNTFSFTVAHHLSNSQSVYVAACKSDGTQLLDNAFDTYTTAENGSGHTIVDVSSEICGMNFEDITLLEASQYEVILN